MLEVIDASFDVINAQRGHQGDREISECSHILGSMFFANSGSVLPKSEVFPVMKFILNIPVRALKF